MIKCNGKDVIPRLNGKELSRVMYNGKQIYPTYRYEDIEFINIQNLQLSQDYISINKATIPDGAYINNINIQMQLYCQKASWGAIMAAIDKNIEDYKGGTYDTGSYFTLGYASNSGGNDYAIMGGIYPASYSNLTTVSTPHDSNYPNGILAGKDIRCSCNITINRNEATFDGNNYLMRKRIIEPSTFVNLTDNVTYKCNDRDNNTLLSSHFKGLFTFTNDDNFIIYALRDNPIIEKFIVTLTLRYNK